MSFYGVNLGVLIFLNSVLFYRERKSKTTTPPSKVDLEDDSDEELKDVDTEPGTGVFDFTRQYLVGHLLAYAADWLQGPHLYAVYKYDKKLAETYVAALYATGFISAALSGAFAGQLADRFGRKKACLVYCGTYAACCLSMLSDNIHVLFAGRFCGGISTTLLYSAFDAWMNTEYHRREQCLSLSTLYGRLTFYNSIVAIGAGMTGEVLVSLTGTKMSPFLLAVMVLGGTAMWISLTWSENYGSQANDMPETSFVAVALAAVKEMWRDKRIFALTTASSLFESMIARKVSGTTEDPPFGIIFASFMCCMMAGSTIFNMTRRSHDVTSASSILKAAIILASVSLSSAVITQSHEYLVFWAFCLVELCVGMYFPSKDFLKSRIIEDNSRANINSIMRMPLSTFVVLAHSLAEEGDHHRNNVFVTFGGALLVALVITHRYLQ
ncbi:hypothetical protein KVR01_006910 [Diaporthe batatas]|uniref:uncharacterized protein n=1 Tax=Diaporthe batatas TaxID=748121 RepID=UPI001D049F68|nr:uncharacterized protein KVR01_006910 [Diaporthe batatas]KAG8163613.1 hypothetical protein KVR01_006910 [Diaporthe batatas]